MRMPRPRLRWGRRPAYLAAAMVLVIAVAGIALAVRTTHAPGRPGGRASTSPGPRLALVRPCGASDDTRVCDTEAQPATIVRGAPAEFGVTVTNPGAAFTGRVRVSVAVPGRRDGGVRLRYPAGGGWKEAALTRGGVDGRRRTVLTGVFPARIGPDRTHLTYRVVTGYSGDPRTPLRTSLAVAHGPRPVFTGAPVDTPYTLLDTDVTGEKHALRRGGGYGELGLQVRNAGAPDGTSVWTRVVVNCQGPDAYEGSCRRPGRPPREVVGLEWRDGGTWRPAGSGNPDWNGAAGGGVRLPAFALGAGKTRTLRVRLRVTGALDVPSARLDVSFIAGTSGAEVRTTRHVPVHTG